MAFIPDPSVAIILVNWNGFDFSVACLESLRKVDFPDFKVILVDNASKNQEGERLKIQFPEIELIQSESNLGFAGGNNLGMKKALFDGYTHVLLLNNDTEVAPDFLGKMLLKLNSNSNVALVQPMILFHHRPDQIWSAGGKWNSFLGRAITLGDRKLKANYLIKSEFLDWATGCCMLIKREALVEVGLLNDSYFTYFEDVDWSLRFVEQGYQISFAAEAEIYHHAGASSKSKHSEGTLSPKVFYYHVRNQLFLIRSHVGPSSKAFAYGYHLLRFIAWMGYFGIRGRFQKFKAVAKGIQDGFTFPIQSPEKWQ